jgi:hypothetical protein
MFLVKRPFKTSAIACLLFMSTRTLSLATPQNLEWKPPLVTYTYAGQCTEQRNGTVQISVRCTINVSGVIGAPNTFFISWARAPRTATGISWRGTATDGVFTVEPESPSPLQSTFSSGGGTLTPARIDVGFRVEVKRKSNKGAPGDLVVTRLEGTLERRDERRAPAQVVNVRRSNR